MPFDKPAGVHRLHKDVSLDFQLNRLVAFGGGRLDEVSGVAKRIRGFDDWKPQLLALAESAASEGRIESEAAYLRAAEFMMHPDDPDKAEAYERQAKLFPEIRADDLETGRLRLDDAPHEGGALPIWRVAPPSEAESRGTILFHGGFDSYAEELYLIARSFSDAGYDTVLFEGPGQGSVLRRRGLPFTTEWEKPVGAVLDHLALDDVTLIGISLGGFLAPRAAAHDSRIKRVVAWGVIHDFFDAAMSSRPPVLRAVMRALLGVGADSAINGLTSRQMKDDALTRWAVEHGTYAMGVDSAASYLRTMQGFTTRDFSSQIKQDFLLLTGTHDHYIPLSHFHEQARALTAVRSFTGRIFTAQEHGHTHCQIGNLPLVIRTMTDWITERSASL